jgi:hypothetical protein
MVKLQINLNEAIALRKHAENQINDLKSVLKELDKEEKPSVKNIEYMLKRVSKWYDFLNYIKYVIYTKNLKRKLFQKKSNQQYIFELSSLTSELAFFSTLDNPLVVWGKNDLQHRDMQLRSSILKIEQKLNLFNTSTIITIEMDEDLYFD